MTGMKTARIDGHVHVGLVGDEHPELGRMSEYFRSRLEYRVFLAYGRIEPDRVCDRVLREATVEAVAASGIDHAVCLALDPVYDDRGLRREDLSHMWVANEYVLGLQNDLGDKVLLGASVHPYDPDFEERVRKLVDRGAVLLKWLPSSQGIDLADERARRAMVALAHLGADSGPLPLLLHTGMEYAIPPCDPSLVSNDFLSWSGWDKMRNALRFGKRWRRPDLEGVHLSLETALSEGAVIIFAHCGLPYFAAGPFALFEHSDLKAVRGYLEGWPATGGRGGRCFADLSACCTPFRKPYFPKLAELPEASLLAGSDFPTPVFELSAGLKEAAQDAKAMLHGDLARLIVPEDNLLDVNQHELGVAFPGHPMFTNLGGLLDELGLPQPTQLDDA